MATLHNGLFGGFSGKLGKVVGYVDKHGRQRIRTVGERNFNNPSINLQANWQKTALVAVFLKPVMEFIRVSFALKAKTMKMSAYNVACAQIRKAIVGTFDNFQIDYSKVIFSRGKLPVVERPEVIPVDEGLMFAWDITQSRNDEFNPTDLAMVMAYYPAGELAFFLIGAARYRQGFAVLELPFSPNGQVLETYISFISDDHKRISNSTYVGQVIFDKPINSKT